MSGAWRWAVWLILFSAWTVSLLTPGPARFDRQHIAPHTHLPVSKILHVIVYTFLTGTAALLPMPKRRRWIMLVVLSLHGMVTEYLQTFIPMRGGMWQDAVLNHIGIALGAVLTMRYWFPARVQGNSRIKAEQIFGAGEKPPHPNPPPQGGREQEKPSPLA